MSPPDLLPAGGHRSPLGQCACIAVKDVTLIFPWKRSFAGVARERVEEAFQLEGRRYGHIVPFAPVSSSTVASGGDDWYPSGGIGSVAAQMTAHLDHATTESGPLLGRLERARAELSSIDTVIITHAFPGHVGGSFDLDRGLVIGVAGRVIGREGRKLSRPPGRWSRP